MVPAQSESLNSLNGYVHEARVHPVHNVMLAHSLVPAIVDSNLNVFMPRESEATKSDTNLAFKDEEDLRHFLVLHEYDSFLQIMGFVVPRNQTNTATVYEVIVL